MSFEFLKQEMEFDGVLIKVGDVWKSNVQSYRVVSISTYRQNSPVCSVYSELGLHDKFELHNVIKWKLIFRDNEKVSTTPKQKTKGYSFRKEIKSNIAYLDIYTGTIKSVYCHSYGYISGNGSCLMKHYHDYNKVKSLVDLGSISSLGEKISPERPGHNFNNSEPGVTVFYHRDRNEDLDVYESKTLEEAVEHMEEYFYIFMEEKWHVYCPAFESYPEDNQDEIKECDDLGLIITFISK